MKNLERILVPVDFSDDSGRALEQACDLAERCGAQLHLLHVIPEAMPMITVTGEALALPPELAQPSTAETDVQLASMPGAEWSDKLSVIRESRVGVPFREIIRYASEHEIDLIVMGTHGRTGFAHMVMGSVAEKVVRKAGCSVMTVRHPDKQVAGD